MQTIARLQYRSRELTLLTPREQAALESERLQLETLWEDAAVKFRLAYGSFLSMQVSRARNLAQARLSHTFIPAQPLFPAEAAQHDLTARQYHQDAVEALDDAVTYGFMACQRIANILYKAYGGIGRLDLNQKRSTKKTVTGEVAADQFDRFLDSETFQVLLLSARELSVLTHKETQPLRPELRKECIGMAIQRLLHNLNGRAPELR